MIKEIYDNMSDVKMLEVAADNFSEVVELNRLAWEEVFRLREVIAEACNAVAVAYPWDKDIHDLLLNSILRKNSLSYEE